MEKKKKKNTPVKYINILINIRVNTNITNSIITFLKAYKTNVKRTYCCGNNCKCKFMFAYVWENHLSKYSYKLTRVSGFVELCEIACYSITESVRKLR